MPPVEETQKEETQKKVQKKVFISYTGADRIWAEWIAWQLEEAGQSVIIQAWDFRPGNEFIQEMQQAATQAERTLLVLSPAYFGSGFTAAEWHAAFQQDPTGAKRLLIPVRIADTDSVDMGLLRARIYIDLVGLSEPEAKERLLAGLAEGRAKPETAPAFPGSRPSGVPHTVSPPASFPGSDAAAQPPAAPVEITADTLTKKLNSLHDHQIDALINSFLKKDVNPWNAIPTSPRGDKINRFVVWAVTEGVLEEAYQKAQSYP